MSKKAVAAILLLVVLIIIGFVVIQNKEEEVVEEEIIEEEVVAREVTQQVIGGSVEGREIEAYTLGDGDTHLLFIGGMHGGYEWNTVILAYQFIDYLQENPDLVPESMTVSVIPSANPDGVFDVIKKEGRFALADVPEDTGPLGTGRFNANGVDLNRNFDCNWQPESTWRGNLVSAGTEVFSEPESKAIRDYILGNNIDGVVTWHSQANAVYAADCNDGFSEETLAMMNLYAEAANYTPIESFDAYPITGPLEGWLADINIPSITVELETHETIEWERNIAGVKALIDYFSISL